MPRSKYTTTQELALKRIRTAKDEYTKARDNLEELLRQKMKEELAELELRLHMAIREASVLIGPNGLPMPKAELKRASRNKDHRTLLDILAEGGVEVNSEKKAVEVDAENNTVTIRALEYKGQMFEGEASTLALPLTEGGLMSTTLFGEAMETAGYPDASTNKKFAEEITVVLQWVKDHADAPMEYERMVK